MCVCDLVLLLSLIGLELSIDQSGLCVEIKVFLSLDTGGRTEGEGVGANETGDHISTPAYMSLVLRSGSGVGYLHCGVTQFNLEGRLKVLQARLGVLDT